jgi:phenylpyruvate tautomerase PptA (4-oxalocrotonate tautomerase family)
MPLIKVHYAGETQTEQLNQLTAVLSKILSSVLGKSEDFIMVIFQKTESQSFGCDLSLPSLYAEVKNVGFISTEISNQLSMDLTNALVESFDVSASRIYIEFQESARHHWGWNGKTFQ